MSIFEFKTFEIEIQNSVFAARTISANEIEKALNEFSEDGWEFVHPIETVTNGYTNQIIRFFDKRS